MLRYTWNFVLQCNTLGMLSVEIHLEFCIATLQTGSFTIQNFVSQPKAVYCVNSNYEH